MDDEKHEINFPLPDNDDIDSALDPKKWENAKTMVNALASAFSRQSLEAYSGAIEAISILAKAIAQIDFHQIYDNISNALIILTDAILNISSPISEEKRQALIKSYKQWGELGWTMPATASIKFFDTPPDTNIKQAHDHVMSLFRGKAGTESLFKEVRECFPVNKDIESAIFCFEHRQYKACALLLFGMIEARLIRWQVKPKNSKSWRKVGSKAVNVLREKYDLQSDEMDLFRLLYYLNLVACLEELFKNPQDFTLDLPVINRNYIAHGMNKRPVRRRDCIQLFLALINTTYFLANKKQICCGLKR